MRISCWGIEFPRWFFRSWDGRAASKRAKKVKYSPRARFFFLYLTLHYSRSFELTLIIKLQSVFCVYLLALHCIIIIICFLNSLFLYLFYTLMLVIIAFHYYFICIVTHISNSSDKHFLIKYILIVKNCVTWDYYAARCFCAFLHPRSQWGREQKK